MSTHRHGGPSASPILVRAVELTEDGQWHNYDDLLRVLSKMVEPGRAIRRAERVRLGNGGPVQRRVPIPDHRLIESGKRSIVRDFLIAQHFEVDPPGRQVAGVSRRIRLLQVPSRIKRDRELAEQGRLMRPDVLVPSLLRGDDTAGDELHALSRKQLLRLIRAMLDMLGEQQQRGGIVDDDSPVIEYGRAPPDVSAMDVRAATRARAAVLLADHRWHDFEIIVSQLSISVPQDVALRKAEQKRLATGTHAPVRVVDVDEAKLARSGSRALVREALTDRREQVRFEIVPPGRPGRVRDRVKRHIRLVE